MSYFSTLLRTNRFYQRRQGANPLLHVPQLLLKNYKFVAPPPRPPQTPFDNFTIRHKCLYRSYCYMTAHLLSLTLISLPLTWQDMYKVPLSQLSPSYSYILPPPRPPWKGPLLNNCLVVAAITSFKLQLRERFSFSALNKVINLISLKLLCLNTFRKIVSWIHCRHLSVRA